MTILAYLSIYISIKNRKEKKKKKETHWSNTFHDLRNSFIMKSNCDHYFFWKLIHSALSNFIAIHVQIFSTSIVHKMLTFKDYYNTINNHSSRTQKYYNFQKWFWKEHSLLAKSTLFNFIRIAFQQNITKHN